MSLRFIKVKISADIKLYYTSNEEHLQIPMYCSFALFFGSRANSRIILTLIIYRRNGKLPKHYHKNN